MINNKNNFKNVPAAAPKQIDGKILTPVVISDLTGINPTDTIYVTAYAKHLSDPEDPNSVSSNSYFIKFTVSSDGTYVYGTLVPVAATTSSLNPDYIYELKNFPQATSVPNTSGETAYIVYIPVCASFRMYFSVNNYMRLQINDTLNIGSPIQKYSDPNYYILYDKAEGTFLKNKNAAKNPGKGYLNWNSNMNPTSVDFFDIPITLQLLSLTNGNKPAGQPAFTVGISKPKKEIIKAYQDAVCSLDTSSTKLWGNLVVPFYNDPYSDVRPTQPDGFLRVLSVSGAMKLKKYSFDVNFWNSLEPFPSDYLTNPALDCTSSATKSSFLDKFIEFYSTNALYLGQEGDLAGITYKGTTTKGGTNMTFTDVSSSAGTTITWDLGSNGQNPLTKALLQADVPSYKFTPSNSSAIARNMQNILTSLITTGLMPVCSVLKPTQTNPARTFPYFQDKQVSFWKQSPDPFGGPWFNLYAKVLHENAEPATSDSSLMGRVYAFSFDDQLDLGANIAIADTYKISDNPYFFITLHEVGDIIDSPFTDTNKYDVQFQSLPPGKQISYRQGNSGQWTVIGSRGGKISGVSSNETTPFQIKYVNESHIFNLFLKYLFLLPAKGNSYTKEDADILLGIDILPLTGKSSLTENQSFLVAFPNIPV